MSEKHTSSMSLEEIRKLRGKTDWNKVKAAGDYDGNSEFDVDWSSIEVIQPPTKVMISLRLDPDILEFFRSQGPGYQTKINAVLRSYMNAK